MLHETHKVNVEVTIFKGVGVNAVSPATTEQHAEPDIRNSVAVCKRAAHSV